MTNNETSETPCGSFASPEARAAIKKLSIRKIEILVLVARHGSIKDAAEAMGVSKPYVSLTVSRAEDSMNVELFSRNSGQFEATEQARQLFMQFERALNEINRIWRAEQEPDTVD